MLFNLVKKDLIITKKNLLFMILFAIGAPIFLQYQTASMNLNDGGFISFFLTAFFSQYVLFNQVSISEEKYKGAALLCATPYTRSALVKAKYLFLLAIFVFCYITYTTTTVLSPIHMDMLNISIIGISLLITTIYFGIMLPVQYQFGYNNTKYIFYSFIFISPFVLPFIMKFLKANNISFQIPSIPPIIQALFPGLLALVIGYVSMRVSIHIYSKKDL